MTTGLLYKITTVSIFNVLTSTNGSYCTSENDTHKASGLKIGEEIKSTGLEFQNIQDRRKRSLYEGREISIEVEVYTVRVSGRVI